MEVCRRRAAAHWAGGPDRSFGGADFDRVTSEMKPEISLGSANTMMAALHAHTVTMVGQNK